jgi:hypothetical protein
VPTPPEIENLGSYAEVLGLVSVLATEPFGVIAEVVEIIFRRMRIALHQRASAPIVRGGVPLFQNGHLA